MPVARRGALKAYLEVPHDGREPREAEQGRVHGEVGVVRREEGCVGQVVLDRGDAPARKTARVRGCGAARVAKDALGTEPDRVHKLDHIGLELDWCGDIESASGDTLNTRWTHEGAG